MRKIDKIIVHCSATREGQHIPVETIKKWHVEGRGWSDIGYHFYVEQDGTIKKGRDIQKIGAHCSKNNRSSIGICYCGGVEADGKTPKDTRTESQKESLLHVLKTLKAMFPESTIYSHNEFANKACPSFNATAEYKDL
jgi:N-acetylmuramoyl-L-alanine amidase